MIHDAQPVKLKVMEIYEPPVEHIQSINTPEFRHQFQFGKLGITATEAHPTPRIRNSCYHCNAIQESSSNLALFNSKNVFETNYIEVTIPDNYGENPILYILGSQ
ncbi:hypothetical protein [Acinetobacter schindleri]|uniref:hypothetical protein n=1 Tax=Acinetobacter schindleri TaxID=108981 RepID=UPI000D3EBE27|nr:hypothetical protein [Acinetobacter schindleri]